MRGKASEERRSPFPPRAGDAHLLQTGRRLLNEAHVKRSIIDFIGAACCRSLQLERGCVQRCDLQFSERPLTSSIHAERQNAFVKYIIAALSTEGRQPARNTSGGCSEPGQMWNDAPGQ